MLNDTKAKINNQIASPTMKQLPVLIFLLTSASIFSQHKNYSVDTVQVKSEILRENRKVIIYKPHSIVNTDSVKFIYLLDGQYSNTIYQELYKQFKDSIPDLIAVGIINTERRRDMLYINSANKFLDFITTELIPIVEKNYKTSIRILNGHSFCGSFTIYTMINKPNYFNCYIASSPTPIMDLIKKEEYCRIDSLSKNKIVFYFSFGSKDMKQVRTWALKLKNNLSGTEFTNLDWRVEIFEGKNHSNSNIVALFSGLSNL